MANYAKAMGYTLPRIREAIIFEDNGSIAASAKNAVQSMQMAGILMGKNGNRFAPGTSATRAEAAAVIHRFAALMIEPATAQGWTHNEAGQWFYYEDGKPATGWKKIGSIRYYFDQDGVRK